MALFREGSHPFIKTSSQQALADSPQPRCARSRHAATDGPALEEGDGDDPRHRAREKHLLSAEEVLRAQPALERSKTKAGARREDRTQARVVLARMPHSSEGVASPSPTRNTLAEVASAI